MSKKKIILYNPKAVFFDMPLALLAVGSALDRERFDVVIVDGRISDDPRAEIKSMLKDALCVGITCLTGSPIRDALAISEQVKAENKDIPVVWGGWHASLFPEKTLEDESCIDITVQGQGELTFRELTEVFSEGGSLADVAGICYRDDSGKVRRNQARKLANLNDLPPVDYQLIDVEAYFRRKKRRQFDYISSAGCFFRCTFCADPFVFGRSYTALSPERIVSEITELKREYRFTDLNFQDETFFTYPKEVLKMAEGFIANRLGISWAATMRADQGARMSEEDFKTCRDSGLRRLLIGVESGSPEMIKKLKKDIKLEQVFLCAERCKKLGISVIFPFIVGFPDETAKDIAMTLRVIRKLRAMSPGFDTPIFYFKPYPGTEITNTAAAEGFQLPRNTREWADFDYIGSTGPWVDADKYRFFENFKFYGKLAHHRLPWPMYPLQQIARWRFESGNFAFPAERMLAGLLRPAKKLS